MTDETYMGEIDARRKGRTQEPCIFKIGHVTHKEVVVRAIDKDGIAPIVALMDADTARAFADALVRSADTVDL